ncbi:hypothetical protein M422DRAFT_263374 [Sphaerobolus stellatus SS14]|uniref:Uncharacterized protein n=1 Tax=Sphaerobolus stellatus (strain SS14) TaxID=990650 RepID=A0A0C9TW49_SPHS4|nr:hypothetical protein M422DRAFT_263374 [Sphaerobolus stellatus SS14]
MALMDILELCVNFEHDVAKNKETEGVEEILPDEYNILLDQEDFIEIDISKESAILAPDAKKIAKMNAKLAEWEQCHHCNEADFDRDIKDAKCARC